MPGPRLPAQPQSSASSPRPPLTDFPGEFQTESSEGGVREALRSCEVLRDGFLASLRKCIRIYAAEAICCLVRKLQGEKLI